jgi:SAM-dependent methyltransferase
LSDPSEEQARRLAAASLAAGDATGWFDRLYAAGVGVPWDRGAPHPLLAGWAEARTLPHGRALVVGSGLGADAEFVAGLGLATTAFDISETAIRATRERFPNTAVDYQVADLLDPPAEWAGAFDFVLESYTVQALPEALRAQATAAVASFVAPGGTLLVIAAGREPGEHVQGPPWPLTRDEVEAFSGAALDLVALERDADGRWRAEFRRGSGTA